MLLRVALAQPDVLPEWSRIRQGVASALVMATHNRTLALGARAHGLPVVGVPPLRPCSLSRLQGDLPY